MSGKRLWRLHTTEQATTMGRFINPFTDAGFKRIFVQEISKPLIIDLPNSLMAGKEHIEGT